MMNQNKQKSLSEVFRELEKNKDKQVQLYRQKQKMKQETSFIFHVKQRTKKDNILLVLVVLIVLLTFSLFSKNYIFAVVIDEEPKNAIGTFEKNNKPKDVYAIVSRNISKTEQKEIFDQEENINFEIKYVANKDMPEEEINVVQEGVLGKKLVTYVNSYQNDSIIEQNIIGERILQDPQEQIIEVGTSQVLKTLNIHINDKLYVLDSTELKKTANIEAETLVMIPKYYDVKTLEIVDETWFKVLYDENEAGYIPVDHLTSETATPEIVENCRKAKILNRVDINMALNVPSGLTLEDYQKILTNQSQDTNHVFKDNYEAFYNAEQKYGINGIFLTSIAIHESGWGKSTIANDKYNLFGFGAYDSSPYESAMTFTNFAEGIDTVAIWLTKNYLNPAGTVLKTGETADGRYYNGANVSGVNIRYASDTEWATKVFATMQNLYSGL